MSLVNFFLVGLIIIWHFLERGCVKKTFTKVKTWMLLSMELFIIIVSIRYSFHSLDPGFYTVILILNSVLGSLTLFLLCFYYVQAGLKKGSGLKQSLEKLLSIFGIVSLSAIAGMAIYQGIVLNLRNTSGICHSAAYILPNSIDLIISGTFLYASYKISVFMQK
jgi:hypothetical protein